jgi:hypothetical protein
MTRTSGAYLAAGLATLLLLTLTRRARWSRPGAWLALLVAGQASTLQWIDAPPAVAYQHLFRGIDGSPERAIALVLLVVQAVIVAVAGRQAIAGAWRWLGRNAGAWRVAALGVVVFLTSATLSREPASYLRELLVVTAMQLVALGNVIALASSLPAGAGARVLTALSREPRRGVDRFAMVLAGGVVVLCALLAITAYQRHPHIPDEVSYLLQARYFAHGMLAMPLPSVPAAFNVDLMTYDATRWYSPFPPGWPIILASGVRIGVPWLVNPILAGVVLVLTSLLLRRISDVRTARLAIVLLGTSPWFLFLGMSLMSHMASLVFALLAALGVQAARQRGALLPALTGGLAIGMVALIRPLEGATVALLMGFWSLAARGRRFRFAPSVALVLGTVGALSLVRPYNAALTGSASVYPVMAYFDRYYGPGVNALGFGANRGVGWAGLDPFPGHGAIDVVVNTNQNLFQVNVELLGWATGSMLLLAIVALFGWLRREDWWYLAAAGAVIVAQGLYWFSGGPDFGARYWFLIIVPCAALVARALVELGDRVGTSTADRGENHDGSSTSAFEPRVLLASGALIIAMFLAFLPWRAAGKYYHYRGMRPDIRRLARDHDFGRSLVLVSGRRHPDYASAVVYNPVDSGGAQPVYAWDASPEIRSKVIDAYRDRPVWFVAGPSITGRGYEVTAGPLDARAALRHGPPGGAAGDEGHVYDPVLSSPAGAASHE